MSRNKHATSKTPHPMEQPKINHRDPDDFSLDNYQVIGRSKSGEVTTKETSLM